MTSVEKRHSKRHSKRRSRSGHRKHSDGVHNDTSSASSFVDETDREVCSLTDRAFRSLCIGEEAVYNDSDLCSSSPSAQGERQQAFSQENQEWDGGDRNREALKRAAHESFGLSLQQYGEGGQYGQKTLGDSQWGEYGEGRTEGRVSATFQHPFMDMSQQQRALRDERLSFLSNGATDLNSQQQRRSRSRVSSLIKAFSSEGYSDGGGNNESSWDKSALMSIQRELSEFSTAYHHNVNPGHFPSRETNLYSSDMVDAVAQMDPTGTFMRSSHSQHSMLTQFNSNSNFFLHSEFSPFQVWRDHSRFPFRQGDISGFMSPMEFPRWYDSPMYKELTFGHQIQGPSMFEQKPLEAVAPPPPPRSTSTSTVLQKASALEKRCESELVGHYPNWKRTQSVGTNRLPSHRPSTVSPTNARSRRGRDAVGSVTELQQKVTMVTTEQSMTTVMSAEQGGDNNSVTPYSNKITTMTVEQGVVSSNNSTTPFNISQLLTPAIHTQQDADNSEVLQYTLPPPLAVEQPPTRGESRGATPEVRMSSYKSRATSLLFNLKDNRKRVKSTYSPTKFKGHEAMDRCQQPSNLDSYEPKDSVVIDIPDIHMEEEPRATDAASYPHSPSHYGHAQQSTTVLPTAVYTAQHTDAVKPDDCLTVRSAQTFGEIDYLTEFSGFTQGSYPTKDQLANRPNVQGGFSPFTPSWSETLADNVYRQASPFKPDMAQTLPTLRSPLPKLNPKPNPNPPSSFRDAMTGERYTGASRYEQVRENTYGVSEAFSQGSWKEHLNVNNTTGRDTETFSLNDRVKPDAPPWKGEIAALIERDKRLQPSYKPAEAKQDLHSARRKYGGENKWNVYEKSEEREYITEERAYPTTDEFLRGRNSLPNKDVFPVLDHTLDNYDDLSNRQNLHYAPITDYTLNQQIIADTPAREKRYSGAFMDVVYGPQEQYGLNEYQTQNELLYGSTKQEHNKQTLYSDSETKYTVGNTRTEQQPVNVNPYTPWVEENKGYVTKQQDSKDVQWNSSFRNESRQYTENMSTTAQVKDNRQYNDNSVQQANEFSAVRRHHYPRNDPNKMHIMPNENRIAEAAQAKVELAVSEETKAKQAKAELARAELAKAKAELAKAERVKVEKAKAEQAKAKLAKAELAKAELAKAELAKAELAKAELAKAELAKAELAKAELAKAELAKAELAKAELAKAEQVKAELAKAELAKAELAKAELAKAEKVKAELAKAELAKAELAKAELAKAEKIKAELAKAELAKAEKIKAELAKAEKIKAELAKAELAKAELAKAEKIKAELAKAELAKAELAKAELAKAELAKAELAKAELAKAEKIKAELAKAELAKAELAKAELAKAELAKAEKIKAEQAKAELAKAELAKAELAKAELAKAEKIKAELAKAELAKAELAKAELAKAELAKAELAKAEKIKAELAKAELAKAELAKAEKIKAEQAKAELAKAELAKAELAKAELAKAELAKAELAKAEKIKAELAKAELAKAELAKAELAKAEKIKAELAKAELAKAELAKAELAKAELAKAELAKAEKIKAELAKAELAKAELAKAELAKAEKIKAELAKAELAKAELAKAELAKAELAKAELAKAELAKAEKIKAELAKAELAKAELAKAELAKAELAKAEKIKAELAKAELAKAESAKAEKIKAELAKAELAKAELAKAEKIKAELAKAEKIKAELAKAELAKAELTKAEKIKAELAKAEKIKAELAKAEQAKAELAKAEQAKAELAKAEQAKAEKVKAELAKAKEEQAKAEQAKAELAKAELAKTELAKAELAKSELAKAKEEQAKAEQAKAELAKAEKVKAELAKAELTKAEQAKAELAKAKVEQAKAELAKVERSKAEQAMVEVTKVAQAKSVLAKAKAELAKAKAQQAKADQAKAEQAKAKQTKADVSASDNVSIGQSVKRELKQMPTETLWTKEYPRGQVKESKHGISDASFNNEVSKDQVQPQTKYQQKDGSTISRVNSDRGPDEYQRVREKYGYSHAVSASGNKRFSQDVTAIDTSKKSVSEVDKYDEASRNEKYNKNEISSVSRHDSAKEEEQEQINVSSKCEEVKENQYIYSESSKEFKLCSADVFPTVESKTTTNETFTIKEQDQGERNDKNAKYDSLIHSFDALTVKTDKHDVPAPRQNDPDKSVLPKRVEQSVALSRDSHSTAFRSLSYKERGQTKQEIMTSKLKAHAEKEISAIKEKGFAMRDGHLARNPTKHLTLGSSNNIRQKSRLREETKKDDQLKQDTASTGIKAETVHFDQLSVRTRNISESQDSHSVKQESLRRDKDTVKQPDAIPVEAAMTKPRVKKEASPFQSRGQAKTEDSLGSVAAFWMIERSKPESVAWSEARESKESTNVLEEMEDAANVESEKKQHLNLGNSQSNKEESINENISEDQNTPLKVVLGRSEAILDSDSLQIKGIRVLIREREQSGSDGLVNKDTCFTQEPTSTKDKENNTVEAIGTNRKTLSSDEPPNKRSAFMKEEKHPAVALSAGDTVSDNKSLTTKHCVTATSKTEEALSDTTVIAEKARVAHQTPLPGGTGETKKESAVSETNKHSNSVLETTKRELDEEEPVIKERGNHLQEESPSLNGSPLSQRETLLPDSPAVKDGHPAVVEPAKNKTVAETLPLVFKKGITARQTGDFEITAKSNVQDGRDGNGQESHHKLLLQPPPREKKVSKKEKADSNNYAVSNRDNTAENLIKQDVQLKGDPAEYDLISAKDRSTERRNAPLVVEKHPDPASEKPHMEKDSFTHVEKRHNKNSTHLNSMTESYSKGIPPSKHRIEMAQSEDTNQAEENVHIDAIAIRVLPGAPEQERQNISETPLMKKHDIKGAEKHHRENNVYSKDVLNVTQETQREQPQNSETAVGGNQLKVLSSIVEGKTLTSKDTERLKANLPASQKSETIHINKDAQQISPPVRQETLPFGYSEEQQSYEDEQVFVLNKSRIHVSNERELVKTRGQNDGRIQAQVAKERGGSTKTVSAGGVVGQNVHIRKHTAQTEREKLYFRPEVTPKERVSTVPEISAIADYARLKVISTEEDRPSSTEDSYSPSKNMGYVPLIQTRHSRRPVFTTETPQDSTMKEAVVVKETEVPTELNKEAKAGVFSAMEQDQKRTGMFRLREKEKQIVSFREDKATEGYLEIMDTCLLTPNSEKADAHYLSTQPTLEHTTPSYVNNEIPGLKGELSVKEEEALSNREHPKTKIAEMQQLNHNRTQKADQSHIPLSPPPAVLPLQYDTKIRNSPMSRQLIPPLHADMPGEDLFSLKAEAIKHVDKTTVPPSLGHMYAMTVEKREEERRVTQREEEWRARQSEEEKRRATQREEERRAKQREEERRAKEREEEKKRATQREEERRATVREEEKRRATQREEERRATEREEEKRRATQREEERRATEREEEKRRATQREEERRATEREEEKKRATQREEERRVAQREEERRSKQREEEERRAKEREEEKKRATQREEERRATERDAERKATQDKINILQYYAISTPEGERKPRDRPLLSPLPAPPRVDLPAAEPSEDWGSFSRPYPSASPALSGTRSNTSSPAPGAKPIMFRVKDNTFRGSSLTKSVKPRFHKSFGEDFRVGSPLAGWAGFGSGERGEEERERARESAGTPVYHDTIGTSHRLPPVRRENVSQSPLPPSHDYHPTLSERRARSRRSLALDEDDSRSVISTMSEDVESFATSAADLADFSRYSGAYDSDAASRGGYERPDSACSFSSDVARALGKPPTVPPKSDKALRRAQRLTTRRSKKETNAGAESAALVEKRSVASVPSSLSELRSSSRTALASPHFSSPVSLAHAPTLVSSVPSSPTDLRPSHRSFHASPHATPPVSLPFASSHPVSLPFAPKSVASVPSSPTHHRVNPPTPVAQYHVEPSYATSSPSLVAQSFPITQRKVLQDPGSGQYFVVNMPVQVKTKTFFDPETGKYVQLNVRQSAQSGSLSHPQPQPQSPYTQAQPQALPQAPPANQPYVLYQGYQGYHQGYQPMPVSSLPPHRSTSGMSVPATLPQDIQEPQEPESARESQGSGRDTYGQTYSPEQVPYMDTAHDTQSQVGEGSVYGENENLVGSSSQPRDIITMSEVEDFMDFCDF